MAHSAVVSSEQYNYEIVKKFAIAAIVWGIAGMTAGVYIASELAWPFLNFDIAQITLDGCGRCIQAVLSSALAVMLCLQICPITLYSVPVKTRLAGGTLGRISPSGVGIYV